MGFKKIEAASWNVMSIPLWLHGYSKEEKSTGKVLEILHRVERLVDLGRISIKMLTVVVSTSQEFMEFSCPFSIFLDCLNFSS